MSLKRKNAEVIHKPWGYELVWGKTEKYIGKSLFVEQGKRLSLQYHKEKDETLLVREGSVEVTCFKENQKPKTIRLGEGHCLRIKPGIRHRLKAIVDSEILEVSTPEIKDVVRLEDDYGRAKEIKKSINIRKIKVNETRYLVNPPFILTTNKKGYIIKDSDIETILEAKTITEARKEIESHLDIIFWLYLRASDSLLSEKAKSYKNALLKRFKTINVKPRD